MDTKLIVGLGNPNDGKKDYSLTRHNIGFIALDCFIGSHDTKGGMLKTDRKIDIRYTLGSVILLKPQDFMNNSGLAVKQISSKLGIPNQNILVVHDDADLDFGWVKITNTKGTTHKGIQSIISYLGSSDFGRVRVGVGRPPDNQTLVEYVLNNFTSHEARDLCQVSKKICDVIDDFIAFGIDKTMNLHNKRKQQ